MSEFATSTSSTRDSAWRSVVGTVAKVGLSATVVLTPLIYAAQRQQDPDIAGSQTFSAVVAGVLGTAVTVFLARWGARDARRAGRTAVTLAVATLVLLPLAWWSPLPIATGTGANALGRLAERSDASRPGVRIAALGGAVLAALGATAVVVASLVALI